MPLGLIDKIVAPATVAVDADDETSGSAAMTVTLAEPGRFAFLDPDGCCVDVCCVDVCCGGKTVAVRRQGTLCMADCDDVRVSIRWKE